MMRAFTPHFQKVSHFFVKVLTNFIIMRLFTRLKPLLMSMVSLHSIRGDFSMYRHLLLWIIGLSVAIGCDSCPPDDKSCHDNESNVGDHTAGEGNAGEGNAGEGNAGLWVLGVNMKHDESLVSLVIDIIGLRHLSR